MVEFLPSYHPALLMKDETKAYPAFISDMKKACAISKGKQATPIPKVQKNPTAKEIAEYFRRWNDAFAFDLETTKAKPHKLLSIACSGGNGSEAFALDLSLGRATVRKRLAEIGRAYVNSPRLVVQNGAFDIPLVYRDYGWQPQWESVRDTMLAGYVLAPDDYINLAHLCSKYLDVYAWKHLSGSDMLTYNGLDAAYTWKLWDAEETELLENKQLQFFARHVMPLLPHAVMALHARGIKLDLKRRRELKHQWDAEYCNWEVELRGHFEALSLQYGQELLAPVGKKGALSSKQMQVLLYDVFKLPEQKHSGTRKTTTDKHALNKLEPMDKTGTITLLLKRSRLKENEHHIQVQPDNDCRVRARYVLGGDEKHRELTEKGSSRSRDKAPGTGRLASREPNHQNVPLSAKIVYVPSLPTWWLVEADSSQIEARLTAYFTKDRMLQEAIDSGDIYLYTLKRLDDATGLYKLRGELDKDDPKISVLRHEAKRAFLGWSYRMGAKKLELHTGIPFKRAKTILDGLNSTFTGVVRKWSEYEAAARSQGYLENPFGRRRYFYKVDVPQVCNFFSQSTAADILFRGHRDLNCDPWTGKIDGVEGYFLATVHDSNLAEGPEWDPVASALRNVMEAPIPELDGLSIPVEIKIGKSWGEMKKI